MIVEQTEQERLHEAHDLQVAEKLDANLLVDCLFRSSTLADAIKNFKMRCAANLEVAIIEHRRMLAAEFLDSGLHRECVQDNRTRARALDDFIHRYSWKATADDYVALASFAPWTPESVLKLLDAIHTEILSEGGIS
jgi:hypothetical protein